MSEQIEKAVLEVVEEFNSLYDSPMMVKGSETAIFGGESNLDSIGLVSFIVEIEDRVGSALGKNISLSDEKAMSRRNSPFRSVGTLVEYIDGLLKEEN